MIVHSFHRIFYSLKSILFFENKSPITPTHIIIVCISSIWLLRFISLSLYPLMDTTEARYAEIARIMEELNDWITPWFDYNIPFWGKPPLSFWLTAISFKLFGVNEFAARFPQFICAGSIAWMVWDLGIRKSNHQALYALALLSSSALFFIAAGAVMTDMVLCVGMTLSMRGFWLALQPEFRNKAIQKYFFYIGLSISLLAKGPIGLLLTYFPVIFWAIATNNTKSVLDVGFCRRGLLLVLFITLPWYICAEIRTPGFLKYFLIGEHWDRFLVPGWKGDLYGSGHHYPRGTIWLFLLADILPWTILIPIFLFLKGNKSHYEIKAKNKMEWRLYFLLWFIAPVCLFTFSKNILWPYVLPGLPALSLLTSDWLEEFNNQEAVQKLLVQGLAITALVPIVFFMSPIFNKRISNKSAKEIISEYEKYKNTDDNLFFFGKRSFSANFYSKGKAKFYPESRPLMERLQNDRGLVVVKNGAKDPLFAEFDNKLVLLSKKGSYELYGVKLRDD